MTATEHALILQSRNAELIAEVARLRAMVEVQRESELMTNESFAEMETYHMEKLMAEAQNESLRAKVATLTAERDRLKACAEHYDDERNWTTATDFDNSYVIYSADFPMPSNGWAVAREALAGGENDSKRDI